MTIAAATTQPVWTPEGVTMVITAIATVLIPALIGVMYAVAKAVAAIREATAANVKADANTRQLEGMQKQVTAVALQTPVQPTQPTDGPKGA